jgi:hypothetical protein
MVLKLVLESVIELRQKYFRREVKALTMDTNYKKRLIINDNKNIKYKQGNGRSFSPHFGMIYTHQTKYF